jgi:hypothetical protein
LKKIVDRGISQRIAEIARRRDELDAATKKPIEIAAEKAMEQFLALFSESQRKTLRDALWQESHYKRNYAGTIAYPEDLKSHPRFPIFESFDFEPAIVNVEGLKSYVANLNALNGHWGGPAFDLVDAKVRKQLGLSHEQEERRQAVGAAFKAVLDQSVGEMQKPSPAEQAPRGTDFKKKIDKANHDIQKQIEALLTAEQLLIVKDSAMRKHDFRFLFLTGRLSSMAATNQQKGISSRLMTSYRASPRKSKRKRRHSGCARKSPARTGQTRMSS